MIADIIHDFDWHLDHGNVYLIELQLPWNDENAEPNRREINYAVYLIANSAAMAQYIANTLYPDALSYSWSDDPISREQYVTRRDVS